MAKNTSERRVELSISAPLLESQNAETRPASVAYAFANGGQMLGRTELNAKGAGSIPLSLGTGDTGIRVLVGPALENKEPGIDELLRRGAQEQHLRVNANDARLAVELPIPVELWRPWLFGRCLVRGTLQKRVVRDGVSIDLPVCRATVEIYEVDPITIVIPKLPKDLLDRLREVVLNPIPIPDPVPELIPEFPSFGPVAGPIPGPIPFARAMPISSSAAPTTMSAGTNTLGGSSNLAGADTLRFAAARASDQAFRQSLIDHPELVRPLLCWLHPQLVSIRRIGTAVTDDCGHFRTYIFKSIFNPDQPDLYFKATQRLFGFFDVTIYAPTPIAWA